MSVQIYNSRFESIQARAESVISHLVGLLSKGYSLCSATSFGKDSSVVLILMLEAIRRAYKQNPDIPRCFVSHSNTGIENPAMDSYTGEMLQALEDYISGHNLPIELVLAEPSVSSSFFYATVGRGKLPRFVESKHRECSIDWKVKPQQRALKRIRSQAGEQQDLVVLVGSRSSESKVRGERMDSGGHTTTALVPESSHSGLYSNSPIADWSMSEVWELLMAVDQRRGGVYQTFVDNFDHTLELYRSANEGTCVAIIGDGGQRASCGSRFGCSYCTVTGARDKSMESMIESDPDTFGYLSGINKLRNFLVRTQYDFARRDWFQRGISEVGYVALSPDNYSPRMRREILRYLLTLDVREQERAEDHAAKFARGELADTPANRRLCHPQFEQVTPKMLAAIDFAWAIYGTFEHAFPAIREWYEVVHLGRRYDIPDIEPDAFPKIPIPEKRYFFTGQYEHPWKIDGLRNIYGEAVNPSRRPSQPPFCAYKDRGTGETRRVAYFEEADELSIDGTEANMFLLDFEDLYFETLNLTAQEGVCYLLDRGLIQIGRGQIATYDSIARRSQHWLRLQDTLKVYNLLEHALAHAISKDAHEELLSKHRATVALGCQEMDLFGFEEVA